MYSCDRLKSEFEFWSPIGEGERDRHPVFFARSNRILTLRNSVWLSQPQIRCFASNVY